MSEVGGNCHRDEVGRKASEDSRGLPVSLSAPNEVRPVGLPSGGPPVLMAGDLNAKHVDWKCRLSMTRYIPLRCYASNNLS
jgi:hypothetical protein